LHTLSYLLCDLRLHWREVLITGLLWFQYNSQRIAHIFHEPQAQANHCCNMYTSKKDKSTPVDTDALNVSKNSIELTGTELDWAAAAAAAAAVFLKQTLNEVAEESHTSKEDQSSAVDTAALIMSKDSTENRRKLNWLELLQRSSLNIRLTRWLKSRRSCRKLLMHSDP
jgi:hypothetical protein